MGGRIGSVFSQRLPLWSIQRLHEPYQEARRHLISGLGIQDDGYTKCLLQGGEEEEEEVEEDEEDIDSAIEDNDPVLTTIEEQ